METELITGHAQAEQAMLITGPGAVFPASPSLPSKPGHLRLASCGTALGLRRNQYVFHPSAQKSHPVHWLVNSDGTVRKEGSSCGIRCRNQFVHSRGDVVYNIPLSCSKVYVGQGGQCVNTRLREHNYAWSEQP